MIKLYEHIIGGTLVLHDDVNNLMCTHEPQDVLELHSTFKGDAAWWYGRSAEAILAGYDGVVPCPCLELDKEWVLLATYDGDLHLLDAGGSMGSLYLFG